MTRAILSMLAVAASVILAQEPATTTFRTASIKPVVPPMNPHVVGLNIDRGTAKLEGATLRQIIVQAYDVQRVRVVGGPGWYDTDQYSILAKAENAEATPQQIKQMLQKLLLERFRLYLHRETRELTEYSLVAGDSASTLRDPRPDVAPYVQRVQPGLLVFRGQPMITLVNAIANMLDTPVEDMTGLAGSYDFELDLTPDPARTDGSGEIANGRPRRPDPRDMGIAAAVERLGLRLEVHKAAMEVLVVDHVERPTEN